MTEVPGTDLLPEATIRTRLSGLKKVVLGSDKLVDVGKSSRV